MEVKSSITTLFTDIGNVLLTDGWNRHSRQNAAITFNLNHAELEDRHRLTFDTYEVGKISLDEYLKRVVFYENRNFSFNDFKEFMFSQSGSFPEMINLVSQLKKQFGLKVAVVSNEGRELTEYRIKKFRLHYFVDFFISSCFVHLRKPDVDIFKFAIDVSQVPVEQIAYLEDRPMFVEVAVSMGIKGIHHTDYNSTIEKLKTLGLEIPDTVH
jgi:putative hydrolase of the HAD superfamily